MNGIAVRAFATRRRALMTLLLLFFLVYFLLPLFWLIVSSTKSNDDLFSTFGLWFAAFHLPQNLHDVFTYNGGVYLSWLGNTAYYSLVSAVGAAFVSTMAGYAFAKYRFAGHNLLFGLLIASMLVPTEVNIPTLYVLFSRIGWLNSYQVQILPGTASVLGMFMARQYMRGLPDGVLEAANVDGAGHWRRFWHFAMPMSLPVLGAIAVLTFVFKWSDYLWPLVMVTDPKYQPIMVSLPQLSTTQSGFIVRYELLLAGCVIITLPLLLLFLRFQETLMRGATAGAVRG
jgi:ABC-type glycerol-3-phosphate transport system permease component